MGAVHVALLAVAAIGSTDTVLLDFQAPWCGPCQRMAPIVAQLQAQQFPIRTVDFDSNHELATRYGVNSIPCFVLIKDGQEVDRIVGAVQERELVEMCARHGVGPAAPAQKPGLFGGALSRIGGGKWFGRGREAAPPVPGGADPDAAARQAYAEAPAFEPPPAAIPTAATFAPAAAPPAELAGAPTMPAPPAMSPIGPAAPEQPASAPGADALLAATVRLRIQEPNGHSVGTGTIVDAREGEALVVTCAHVFRESKGQGQITVDLFTPAVANLPGRMISYDLESDVALVAFRPGGPVSIARVAPAMFNVREGDGVLTIGCNHGEPPTVVSSQVLSLNKFAGAPNLQIAGQPVQGRSGGGLFSREGYLIGVCNAADPQDNQGLFAALPAVQSELDKMQLSDVYRATPADLQMAAASATPQMPDQMPLAPPPAAPHAVTAPPAAAMVPVALANSTSAPPPLAPTMPTGAAASMTPEERATLAELESRTGDAEVICVIRPLNNPQAKSEIIVLNQASPEFIRQLSAAKAQRPQRQLTSLAVPRVPQATATTAVAPAQPVNPRTR
ncbi:MAG: trypsin-like peptidase domain-containing protein [Pirellulales bacterium]|nr:trypsin-like peptidase domain-containing protein [Pirellulales bacterium]